MTAWHESDSFWEVMAPMIFDEQHWATASEETNRVIDLLELLPGTSVLDLCSGPGRHSLELARRGFRVTAVDRTAAFLKMAQERAEGEGLEVEFVQADMRRFCRPGSFDAILMMFTSFGYFEDPAENLQVLVNAFRSLKDGGSLIVELMGKEVLARIFQARNWDELDGAFLLQERRVSRNWCWMENRWILLKDGKRHDFEVTHWIYSAAELSGLLGEAGFSMVDVYGDLSGTAYDHNARRLVAVARK